MSFTVKLNRDDQVFSAAHFITFNGSVCERLHGHNYRVAVEVTAPLDENSYVFDFIALRKHTLSILAELDHRMLVPMIHPQLAVNVADEVTIRFEAKRWVFPFEDCVLLKIENTTVELLAQWIAERLLRVLSPFAPQSLRVDVEENFGQWATWTSSVSDAS